MPVVQRPYPAAGVIVFDIYGTIIDPDGMTAHLQMSFGAMARDAARVWREKQVEYSFRRALMRRYFNFDVCTEQALTFVSRRFHVALTDKVKHELLKHYRRLPPFPDVRAAFESLDAAGFKLVALTNGTVGSVRELLRHAHVLHRLEAVVSVDTIRTFKPNPDVYNLLVKRVKKHRANIWFVSSNPWDVIGAKAYGLKSIWLQRDSDECFDYWGVEPDRTVSTLAELVRELRVIGPTCGDNASVRSKYANS